MASGGWHPPTRPAFMSGQGANSKRTDGSAADLAERQYIPSPEYGAGAELNQQASAAANMQPGAGQQDIAGMLANLGSEFDTSHLPPASAPTQRPDESGLAGVDMGDGPGASALVMPDTTDEVQQDNTTLTTMIGLLTDSARDGKPTAATNNLIRLLRGQV